MSGEVTKLLELPDSQSVDGSVAPEKPLEVVAATAAQGGSTEAAQSPFPEGEVSGLLPLVAHDVHLIGTADTPHWQKAVLACCAVLALAGVFFAMNPLVLTEVLVLVGLGPEEVVVPAPAPVHRPKKEVTAVQPLAPKNESVAPITIWQSVDNDYGAKLADVAPPLSADQEAQFQAGLDSEFTYQRYKTVLDIAKTRARGTEDMLRQALESKKFWTRMRAVIALADMGEEISETDIKTALGDAHSELRARFFKRFEKSPCGTGCYYIARASLPHLDAMGREEVIRVVSREESDIRDVFMVAATFDESSLVRQAAAEWLDSHSPKPDVWQSVKALTGH